MIGGDKMQKYRDTTNLVVKGHEGMVRIQVDPWAPWFTSRSPI